MSKRSVPAALYLAVKRDLRPVRPLASPSRRALALLPVAIFLLVAMPVFWAWRTQGVPAPWPSWGLSVLETALSLVVLGAAFREAVPGRELSARALSVLICIACIGFLLAEHARAQLGRVPIRQMVRQYGNVPGRPRLR